MYSLLPRTLSLSFIYQSVLKKLTVTQQLIVRRHGSAMYAYFCNFPVVCIQYRAFLEPRGNTYALVKAYEVVFRSAKGYSVHQITPRDRFDSSIFVSSRLEELKLVSHTKEQALEYGSTPCRSVKYGI